VQRDGTAVYTNTNTADNTDTYRHADCYSNSNTYSHANGNTNTDANCYGYRCTQSNAAASSRAASSSESTVIAGRIASSTQACFLEREDGPQGHGDSRYGFK